MNNRVVLSAVLPSVGGTVTYRLNKSQAIKWLERGEFTNFVQHETVRLLNIEPATERLECDNSWQEALIIKPQGRLERGKEYTADEIEALGYDIFLIVKFSVFAWGHEGYVRAIDCYPNQGDLSALSCTVEDLLGK